MRSRRFNDLNCEISRRCQSWPNGKVAAYMPRKLKKGYRFYVAFPTVFVLIDDVVSLRKRQIRVSIIYFIFYISLNFKQKVHIGRTKARGLNGL